MLTNAAKGLVSIVATIVLTAWLTGQPLTGLTKLKGLLEIFLKGSIPAWIFALVLFAAFLGLLYFFTHLPSARLAVKTKKLHFVPDAHNSGWAATSDSLMEVRMGGTFTYEGDGAITLLKAFLKGTQPVTDMLVQVHPMDGGARLIPVQQIELRAHIPVQAYLILRLKPRLGIPGKKYVGQMLFRDEYNKDFPVATMEFPYLGK